MKISKEWLATYEKAKDLLAPSADLNAYFKADEIAGIKVLRFTAGKVNFPTGKILARDPLVYVNRDAEPYFTAVPTGIYDITVAVLIDEGRYAALKVDFSDKEPVRYVEALIGNEDLDNFKAGEFFGFNVDAGLATIMDVQTRDAFCDFEDEWYRTHEDDANIYDDFFSDIFEQSAKDFPDYQRPGGDWINWVIPGTDLSVPMIQSGYGDGAYPVYLGYDAGGSICRLVIQFIDIELELGDG